MCFSAWLRRWLQAACSTGRASPQAQPAAAAASHAHAALRALARVRLTQRAPPALRCPAHCGRRGRRQDARHPQKYRMLVPMVDVVFADVAQPDQARIVGLNAQHFLKNGGHYVISIKASCIDSTAAPEAVFAREIKKLQEMQLKPREQVRAGQGMRRCATQCGVRCSVRGRVHAALQQGRQRCVVRHAAALSSAYGLRPALLLPGPAACAIAAPPAAPRRAAR